MSRVFLTAMLINSVILGSACGDKVEPDLGLVCTVDRSVTYQIDIRPFLEAHCTRCHSSALSGTDRMGAPVSANFDSYAGIASVSQQADLLIQSGVMPPGLSTIPDEDRELFACWVEQGTPEVQ